MKYSFDKKYNISFFVHDLTFLVMNKAVSDRRGQGLGEIRLHDTKTPIFWGVFIMIIRSPGCH